MTESKASSSAPMFVSALWHSMVEPSTADLFVLERGKGRLWDDNGFRTLYNLYHLPHGSDVSQARLLGPVKIFRRDERVVDVPTGGFVALGDSCCSLGQTPEYYENLQQLGPETCRLVLTRLRDLAYDRKIGRDFADEEGVRTSLFRTLSAKAAFEAAGRLFHGEHADGQSGTLAFRFTTKLPGFDTPHRLDVEFSRDDGALGRLMVLVGKNATGKSGLISALAQTLSGLDAERGTVEPSHVAINRVIAISYSAFDSYRYFARARPTESVGYFYCGLRDHKGEIDFKGALDRSQRLLTQVDPERWRAAIRRSGILREEPAFTALIGDPEPTRFIEHTEKLSSGHKIFVFVLANLLATIRPRSLVLFDEPETHLHPNLLASLLRLLHNVLEEEDSFALVATHAPQVLQEVPARFIRIVTRDDERTQITGYPGETFGANLGEIVRCAFGVDDRSANYSQILRTQHDEAMLRRWLQRTLAPSLSLAPYAVLAGALEEREGDDETP